MSTDLARRVPDISSNNPIPDLSAFARAGYRHLCRKVTEGTRYHWLDGDLVADRAHALKLVLGHYHWLRPDLDPVEQARFFAASLRGRLGKAATTFDPEPDGDWLMVDLEATQGAADPSPRARAKQLRRFVAELRRLLPGFLIAVYTGNWYLDGKVPLQREVRKYPVVISGYAATPPSNPYQLTYVAWQFTDRLPVPGFTEPIDCSVWLGTATRPAPPPQPTQPGDASSALKAGSMYELIQDASNGYWYAYALGVWIRIRHKATLAEAVASPLCINRTSVAKKHTAGYQLPHARVVARQQLALGSAAA